MSQMDAKAEETWQWSKSEGVWLVFNGKSEGFIANSERSAIVACHYLNALQQQLADLQAERDFAQEELAKTGALFIRAAAERDRYRKLLKDVLPYVSLAVLPGPLDARIVQFMDALSSSPIAPEEVQR